MTVMLQVTCKLPKSMLPVVVGEDGKIVAEIAKDDFEKKGEKHRGGTEILLTKELQDQRTQRPGSKTSGGSKR